MVLLSFGDGTGYTTDQADSQSWWLYCR
jgi:hypothetical protein